MIHTQTLTINTKLVYGLFAPFGSKRDWGYSRGPGTCLERLQSLCFYMFITTTVGNLNFDRCYSKRLCCKHVVLLYNMSVQCMF